MNLPLSSPLATETKLLGLGFDHFFVPAAMAGVGVPVLIDKDGDAQVTLADGAAIAQLQFFTDADATLGIKLTPGAVEISTTSLEAGSAIRIDGVTIGTVDSYDGTSLTVTFAAAMTPEEIEALRVAAEKLIRALTFTDHLATSPSPERSVSLVIVDGNGNDADATMFAADRILGDGADNVLEIESGHLSWGDEIDGGAGADTLKIKTGGVVDFIHLSKFEGVETIQGSAGNDTIHIFANQIATIDKIDGGGQARDFLNLSGNAIDLRGILIGGFASINYEGLGTTVIVDDFSTAKLLDGDFAEGETLTIAGGTLTDAERLELHKNGIDFIMHNGRTTKQADVEGSTPSHAPTEIVLSKPSVAENTMGSSEIGSLSAIDPDANDNFTYTLLDDAGGRFAIANDRLIVKDGNKLDYEQTQFHAIKVKVTDKDGLSFEKDFAIAVTDVREDVPGATKARNKLVGGIGADKLNGLSGNDVLTGGAGADAFVFDTALGKGTTPRNQNKKVNFDTITDFKPGEDKIWLDNRIFKKLGKGSEAAPSALNKKFFKLTKATDANDYVIYKKGVVSYDADGSGTRYKPVEIIKIANKAKLTAGDFLVV